MVEQLLAPPPTIWHYRNKYLPQLQTTQNWSPQWIPQVVGRIPSPPSNSPKLDSVRLFHTANYLNQGPHYLRPQALRFRCSNHRLDIELGRHPSMSQPNLNLFPSCSSSLSMYKGTSPSSWPVSANPNPSPSPLLNYPNYPPPPPPIYWWYNLYI